MDIKNKRILICQPMIFGIIGSTMVTLELANELKKDNDVIVYTNILGSPAKEIFQEHDIRVITFDDEYDFKLSDFDIVWVHSQTLPKSLVRDFRNVEKLENVPIFIFVHLSQLDICPDERPWIFDLEKKVSDKTLCMSDATKEVISYYLDSQIDLFRNPAPDIYIRKPINKEKLENVLIVSNHCPNEVIEATILLKDKYGVNTDLLGVSGKYMPLTPEFLQKFDAVITIGKTVQACMLSGIPVYIYDRFGGDGYLNENNYLSNKKTNFSGRNNNTKKTPEMIADEIYNNYAEAWEFFDINNKNFIKEYSLSKVLHDLFNNLKIRKKKNFDEEYIKYVELSQDVARHMMFYGGFDSFNKGKIIKQKEEEMNKKEEEMNKKEEEMNKKEEEMNKILLENNQLLYEINTIKESKSYKIARKLVKFIKRK